MWVFLVLFLLLLATGFLALAETSLIASRHARLDELKDKGSAGAERALNLATHADWLLSTLEVGVTLISIILGAVAEGTMAHLLSSWFKNVPYLSQVGPHALAIAVVALVTYLTLISQLVPKRIALRNPESIATAVSGPVSFMVRLFTPVVAVVNASSDAVLRLLPPTGHRVPVTDAEVLNLINAGTRAGVFEETEYEMFQSVLELESVKLSSIMVPRTEMHWLDIDDDDGTILGKIARCNLWQLPVAEGNSADNILGVIDVPDIVHAVANKEKIDLRKLLRPALYVPDSEDALFMLQTFRRTHALVAVLLDEFGGVTGIVSARAVVEQIVGDIGGHGPNHITKADGSGRDYVVDGLTPIDEFADEFHLGEINPRHLDVSTVGGLVMDELGHLPRPGEELDWQGLHLKVVSLEGHRIDKIRVSDKRAA